MQAGVDLPGVVFCAPALERREEPNLSSESLRLVGPTVIVHGANDDVIPIDVSRRYAARTGARLIEVVDDHRLQSSRQEILAALAALP